MVKGSVALIYGGQGLEREVSLRGAKYILPFFEKKYNCLPILIESDGRWLLQNREVYPARKGFITAEGERFAVDTAYPLLHGDYGEDGRVQGALDCAGIKYVGCGVSASALCRDKSVVKSLAKGLGIPTLPHILISGSDDSNQTVSRSERLLGYPMIIKPTSLGSSIGVRKAEDRGELLRGLEEVFSLCDRAIAEPILRSKRELEVAYFSYGEREAVSPPSEVVVNGIYDYEKKYISGKAELITVARIDGDTARRIKEYSRRLVSSLGIRHIARIDFFLADGELYLNEINTMPGHTEDSLYLRMVEAMGIPKEELLQLLIEDSIVR